MGTMVGYADLRPEDKLDMALEDVINLRTKENKLKRKEERQVKEEKSREKQLAHKKRMKEQAKKKAQKQKAHEQRQRQEKKRKKGPSLNQVEALRNKLLRVSRKPKGGEKPEQKAARLRKIQKVQANLAAAKQVAKNRRQKLLQRNR